MGQQESYDEQPGLPLLHRDRPLGAVQRDGEFIDQNQDTCNF